MLVLGVALLAGFLFIGGGAAIYLSTPPQPNPGNIALGDTPSPGISLPAFVQETPTPDSTPLPTDTPLFFSFVPDSPSPSGLFFTPTPSFILPTPTPTPTQQTGPTPTPTQRTGPTPTPTQRPTPPPTATPTPTPSGPSAGFGDTVNGNFVQFMNKSSGSGLHFQWDFGDGSGSFRANPKKTYANKTADYTVTLTVTDSLGRSDTRSKPVHIDAVVATPTPVPTDAGPTPGASAMATP